MEALDLQCQTATRKYTYDDISNHPQVTYPVGAKKHGTNRISGPWMTLISDVIVGVFNCVWLFGIGDQVLNVVWVLLHCQKFSQKL